MTKPFSLPTLLIVTDNPTIRLWIQNHLKSQFFILHAETKLQAIQSLNMRLDLIFLDADFEEGDSLALAKEMSGTTKKGLIPIILITGNLKMSYREKATKAGITDFVSNQLDLEEIQKAIEAGMKAAAAREKTEGVGRNFKLPQRSEPPPLLKKKFDRKKQKK